MWGQAALTVARVFGVVLGDTLGGRSSRNWRGHRDGDPVVLRQHLNLFGLSVQAQADSLAWEQEARGRLIGAGWPVAEALGGPILLEGSYWTLERLVPGVPADLAVQYHAGLWARWSELGALGLGLRPSGWDPLGVLADAGAEDSLRLIDQPLDRELALSRLDSARALMRGVSHETSQTLVHGDLTAWNLLWTGPSLTGVIDLELAHVGPRTTEAVHVWRCRYDDILWAYHRHARLTPAEWRAVLATWWANSLSLLVQDVRAGRELGQWQLQGLRRDSQLATSIRDGRLG